MEEGSIRSEERLSDSDVSDSDNIKIIGMLSQDDSRVKNSMKSKDFKAEEPIRGIV